MESGGKDGNMWISNGGIQVTGSILDEIHRQIQDGAAVAARDRKDSECSDYKIKASGLAPYIIARAAFMWQKDSAEARELAKRWRVLFARYASLSERYRQNVHAMRSLHVEWNEISDRLKKVDAGFDALSVELNKLYAALAIWADLTWERVED